MTDPRLATARLAAACAALATAAAVLPAAGCSGGRPPPAAPAAPSLAARYLAIARPANRELDHDFDGLDHAPDLAAARTDLRNAAATERRFDRQLTGIAFPSAAEPVVRLLYRVNQSRAALTGRAAAAASRQELRGYERQLQAASRPVEDAVTVIRGQLGLPPPATS